MTYIGPKDHQQNSKHDPDLVFATKPFRKLSQKTPHNLLGLNFWYIEDPALARRLKIDSAGDVYLVQSDAEGSINYNGYSLKSDLFLTFDDLYENIKGCHEMIYERVFRNPVIMSSPMAFNRLRQVFGAGYDFVVLYGGKSPEQVRRCQELSAAVRDELSQGGPGANQLIIVIAESEDVAQPVQVRFNSKKLTDSIQALFVPSNMASQDTVIDSL